MKPLQQRMLNFSKVISEVFRVACHSVCLNQIEKNEGTTLAPPQPRNLRIQK